MEGRIFSPPARPLAPCPRAADRAEHVPTHDGGTDTRCTLREEGVVEPLTSAFSADHLTAASGSEDPFMELGSPDPERIVEILVGPGAVAVERDRVVAHEQSRHWDPPSACSHCEGVRHTTFVLGGFDSTRITRSILQVPQTCRCR